MVITLSKLIELAGEKICHVEALLQSFACNKDESIKNFLTDKAIEFEKLAKARTYLIVDGGQNDSIRILGYFSLSLKVLILPDSYSIRERKMIDGYRGKINGQPVREIPCYLIGQLAKNSDIEDNKISGKDLIEAAVSVIYSAKEAVGGRNVIIECRDVEPLLNFYRDNGFKEIMKKPIGSTPMVQMLRQV